MSDLDRLLKESLTAVSDSYSEARATDRIEARARFIERYRRRRRIVTVGSFAFAAAAIITLGVFAADRIDLAADAPSDVAGKPGQGLLAQIKTGSEPVDAGVRPGGIWVANQGESTIVHLNPQDGEVIARINLDGPPQEVDVGESAIWVAGFGHVTALDPQSDELIGAAEVGEEADPITISVGEDAVWAVVARSRLVKIDPTNFETKVIRGATRPVDVAAREGSVWVLDLDQGLLQLDPATGKTQRKPIGELTTAGDISAGGGAVWVASQGDDTIFRLDAKTRQISGLYRVKGTYLDMAVYQRVVWVLSQPEGNALLTALDTTTGLALGKPLQLTGDPVEVSFGGGGVWVVARERGAIYRIDHRRILGEI